MEIEKQQKVYQVRYEKTAIPSLGEDDNELVEDHRLMGSIAKEDGTYPMGTKKGKDVVFTYKGVSVTIRYDKTSAGVYPRVKVNGDDLSTEKLMGLVDAIQHQIHFFAGVRGEEPVIITPKERKDHSTGIQVRAVLLASDTLDFTSETLTAAVLAKVNNVESYKNLFKAGRREFSYGGLLSQNINTSLEQSTDRIGVYKKFGELISNRKTGKNNVEKNVPELTLNDSTQSHLPLFRKLRAMLKVSPPEAFVITLADGTPVQAADFIRIADGVALKLRIEQENEVRSGEATRDVVSDAEDEAEDEEFGGVELSSKDIEARLDRMRRIRANLDVKIAKWERLLKNKDAM